MWCIRHLSSGARPSASEFTRFGSCVPPKVTAGSETAPPTTFGPDARPVWVMLSSHSDAVVASSLGGYDWLRFHRSASCQAVPFQTWVVTVVSFFVVQNVGE